MAVLDNLTTAKEQIAAQLVDLTINPKPTYSLNGRSISWGEHFRNLTDQLEKLNQLIQVEGGPIELVTIGVP